MRVEGNVATRCDCDHTPYHALILVPIFILIVVLILVPIFILVFILILVPIFILVCILILVLNFVLIVNLVLIFLVLRLAEEKFVGERDCGYKKVAGLGSKG